MDLESTDDCEYEMAWPTDCRGQRSFALHSLPHDGEDGQRIRNGWSRNRVTMMDLEIQLKSPAASGNQRVMITSAYAYYKNWVAFEESCAYLLAPNSSEELYYKVY
jgi:hypothetical protein